MTATEKENRVAAGPRTVAITFQPSGRRFTVAEGESLFEVAAAAGVRVDTVCGGNGSCGKCKVRFDDAPPQATPLDYLHLSGGEIGRGFRLSCQVSAERDMAVYVPASGDAATVRLLHQGLSREVPLQPNIRKVFVPYADPRTSQHVADWDRVRRLWPRQSRPRDIALHLLRKLPSAIRDPGGMTLVLAGRKVIAIEPGDTVARQYGVAFDVGSTSVVGFLVDLGTGDEIAVASAVNRQAVYGDDIIGRLSRAQRNPEGLATLNEMVLGQLNGLLAELAAEGGIEKGDIYEVTVVGNMAMHHFLLALDSTFLGLSPYAPVVRDALSLTAGEIGLELGADTPVFVLPNIAGFVGSDTVAVMLATDIGRSEGFRLAIDVGTNGEIVLANRKRILACSAPAGPAMEGARISQGMRAAPGAIDHVRVDDDVHLSVIGGGAPKGICGSALIDIVAQLLDAGLLNASGAYLRHAELPAATPAALRRRLIEAPRRRDTYFVLARPGEGGAAEEIAFTQQDVRECQLAKGAIRAGAEVLMGELGLGAEDLEEILLAGAFGNFLDPASALRAGLVPPVPLERVRSVGNAAGFGAKLALVSVVERRRAQRLADRTEHIQLGGLDAFQKAFTHAMRFPRN